MSRRALRVLNAIVIMGLLTGWTYTTQRWSMWGLFEGFSAPASLFLGLTAAVATWLFFPCFLRSLSRYPAARGIRLIMFSAFDGIVYTAAIVWLAFTLTLCLSFFLGYSLNGVLLHGGGNSVADSVFISFGAVWALVPCSPMIGVAGGCLGFINVFLLRSRTPES